MSFILDALRKVEREKLFAQQPAIDIKARILGDLAAAPGLARRRTREAAVAGALLALAGSVWLAAGVMQRHNAAAPFIPAVTKNEPAATVSAAGERAAAPVLMEEQGRANMPAAKEEAREGDALPARIAAGGAVMQREEQGAGPRGVAEEVSPRNTDGPASSLLSNRPRGNEPPAVITQAAPAPVFTLDGIIYHEEAGKRSALVRVRGGESVLLRTGETVHGYTVELIDQARVLLVKESGKRVELTIE